MADDPQPSPLGRLAAVIPDPWFVVDLERNLREWNQAFRALFPRAVARDLGSKRCYEVLRLAICETDCIALRAVEKDDVIRLDQVPGCIVETGEEVTLLASATPITGEDEASVGALVVYRNVTDDSRVQHKYKALLEEESELRRDLEARLRERTRQMLEANEESSRLELELSALRKGIDEPEG